MKKVLIFLVIFALLISMVVFAFAQSENGLSEKELEKQRYKEQKQLEFSKILNQKVKDQKKILIVKKINQDLNLLNEKMTAHYLEVVERLNRVLSNLRERVNLLKTKGKEMFWLEERLNDLETKIEELKAVVKNQSEKIYELQITNEAELKNTVGLTRQKLINDLKELRTRIMTIREDLKKIIQDFGNFLRSVNN